MGRREELEAVAASLKRARRVAVVGHLNPDGDAIGASLAMRLILQRMGREAEVFNRDRVPDTCRTLEGADTVRPLREAEGTFDLLLFVDCAEPGRVMDLRLPEEKAALEAFMGKALRTAQIDHHPTNPRYADDNAVDGKASAACCLVYDLMGILGIAPDRALAECLYTGIATDTGNFLQDNTDDEALAIAGALRATGFDQAGLSRKLFSERRPEQVALLTRALRSLRYSPDGKVTCMALSLRDFEETGALPEDADTIVNFGRDIRGVRMALLAREMETGVKMSLRSLAPVTISDVARRFGGGGHPMAAGCTLTGLSLEEAADKVFLAMQEAMAEQEKA